jgi:hypothetical protein
MQISTIVAMSGCGQNFGMSAPSTTPAHLNDDELQNLASEWRIRAMQGDQLAHRMAQALEAEQRRRIRDTGLQTLPPAASSMYLRKKPWWKFW